MELVNRMKWAAQTTLGLGAAYIGAKALLQLTSTAENVMRFVTYKGLSLAATTAAKCVFYFSLPSTSSANDDQTNNSPMKGWQDSLEHSALVYKHAANLNFTLAQDSLTPLLKWTIAAVAAGVATRFMSVEGANSILKYFNPLQLNPSSFTRLSHLGKSEIR